MPQVADCPRRTTSPGRASPRTGRIDAGASTLPNRLDLGTPNAPLTYATAQGDPAIVNALLRAGADPKYADPSGWTALMAAVNLYSVSCAIALIKAGADLEAVWTLETLSLTPLLLAVDNSPRMIPILLRAGARLDMSRINEDDYINREDKEGGTLNGTTLTETLTYLRDVDAAGGWKKYEQAHRKRLTTTFAKAFPRLPVDAISHVVDFAFHVGFY